MGGDSAGWIWRRWVDLLNDWRCVFRNSGMRWRRVDVGSDEWCQVIGCMMLHVCPPGICSSFPVLSWFHWKILLIESYQTSGSSPKFCASLSVWSYSSYLRCLYCDLCLRCHSFSHFVGKNIHWYTWLYHISYITIYHHWYPLYPPALALISR